MSDAPPPDTARARGRADGREALRACSQPAQVRRLRARFERALAKTGRAFSSIIRSRNRLREKEKSETLSKAEKKELLGLRRLLLLHSEWYPARLRMRMFGPIARLLARVEKRKTPNGIKTGNGGESEAAQ